MKKQNVLFVLLFTLLPFLVSAQSNQALRIPLFDTSARTAYRMQIPETILGDRDGGTTDRSGKSFTISSWVKLDSIANITATQYGYTVTKFQGAVIMGHGAQAHMNKNGSMTIGVDVNGNLCTYAGADNYKGSLDGTLEVGAWTYLTIVYNNDDWTFSFYKNGELLNTVDNCNTGKEKQQLKLFEDDPTIFFVGGAGFDGACDEFQFFNKALSAEEVAQAYADPSAVEGLTAWYDFNEATAENKFANQVAGGATEEAALYYLSNASTFWNNDGIITFNSVAVQDPAEYTVEGREVSVVEPPVESADYLMPLLGNDHVVTVSAPINFYDYYGKDGNIPDSPTTKAFSMVKFQPANEGDVVTITFNKIGLNRYNGAQYWSNWAPSAMLVYNGELPLTAFPDFTWPAILDDVKLPTNGMYFPETENLMQVFDQNYDEPVVLFSTAEDGSLTVAWHVNYCYECAGWEAVVTSGAAPEIPVDPIENNSIEFNGVDQYMRIPHSDDFNAQAAGTYTVTLKVNLDELTANNDRFVSKRSYEGTNNGNTSGWELWGDGSNNTGFSTNLSPAGSPWGGKGNGGGFGVSAATWTHLAWVFDMNANTTSVYIDGVLKEAKQLATEFQTMSMDNTFDVLVGAGYLNAGNTESVPAYFMDGKMDDLRFWSKALTADEITTDMTATVDASTEGLVAAYDFNTIENNIVVDITGRGNDATLVGFGEVVVPVAPTLVVTNEGAATIQYMVNGNSQTEAPALVAGEELKFIVTAPEGKVIESVTWNGETVEEQYGEYVVTVAEGENALVVVTADASAETEDYLMPRFGQHEVLVSTPFNFYDGWGTEDIPGTQNDDSFAMVNFKPANEGDKVTITFKQVGMKIWGTSPYMSAQYFGVMKVYDGVVPESAYPVFTWPESNLDVKRPSAGMYLPDTDNLLQEFTTSYSEEFVFTSTAEDGSLSVGWHLVYPDPCSGWEAVVSVVSGDEPEPVDGYLMPQFGNSHVVTVSEPINFYDMKGLDSLVDGNESNSFSMVKFKPANEGDKVMITFKSLELLNWEPALEYMDAAYVSHLRIYNGDLPLSAFPESLTYWPDGSEAAPIYQVYSAAYGMYFPDNDQLLATLTGTLTEETTFTSTAEDGTLTVGCHLRMPDSCEGWVAVVSIVPGEAPIEYCTYEGVNNHSERWLRTLTVKDLTLGSNNEFAKGSNIYQDFTESVFEAAAGETIAPAVDWNGAWMHGYMYIDYNNDGEFTYELDAEGYPVAGGEIVSYSFYSPSDAGTGKNSLGEEVANNVGVNAMPQFTLPADLAAGDYRVRFMVDWCAIDPCGHPESAANLLTVNGGIMLDFTMRVPKAVATVTVVNEGNATIEYLVNDAAQTEIPELLEGDELTFVVAPASGYILDAVKFNGEEITATANQYVVTVAGGENTLEIVSTLKPVYTLALENSENGVVEAHLYGDQQIVLNEGENASLSDGFEIYFKFTPDEGYELGDVLVNGVPTEMTYFFGYYSYIIHEDMTVAVEFNQIGGGGGDDTEDYCTFEGTNNHDQRWLNTITVKDLVIGGNGEFKKGSNIYQDFTESKFEAEAGETIAPVVDWNGEWMHSYMYIDYNNDGVFTPELDDFGGVTPASELVSFTYYEGVDSYGGYVANNCGVNGLPEFTLPADLAGGEYRVRFKIDWNSVDPCGHPDSEKDPLSQVGGLILDFTMVIPAPVEYCTYEGNNNHGGRWLNSLTMVGGNSEFSITGDFGQGTPVYQDYTAQIFAAAAGAEITPEVNWNGEWMHGYMYIDYNNDGVFTPELDDFGGVTPASELVSFTYYNDVDSYGGYAANNSAFNNGMPSFTLPETLALGDQHRVRFIIDWNNIDPCGNLAPDNLLSNNGGIMLDFTLEVANGNAIEGLENAGVKVYATDGKIVIESEEEVAVQIFTTNGVAFKAPFLTVGYRTVDAPAGIYIVNVNGVAKLVMVK